MDDPSEMAAGVNAEVLRTHGEDITYLPGQGAGAPVSEKAILCEPDVEQSRSPGYFATVEVDPGIVREIRDEVIWGDGKVYVVTPVRRRAPYGLVRLALHQKYETT